MRFYFPNIERPKATAKRLTQHFPNVALSKSQQAIAASFGYSSWHSLEKEHKTAPPTPLDEKVSLDEARQRWTSFVLGVSNTLGLRDGDVQSHLEDLRPTGNRRLTFEDHETVRTACWRAGPLPYGRRRTTGMTCIITEERRRSTRRRAYVRKVVPNGFGDRPVEIISDWSAGHGGRADFEVICPRVPVPDFVPFCLWLPYGWCFLEDGSELLFSREYHPLWRIRPNGDVERANPWEGLVRPFFWFNNISGYPWSNEATQAIVRRKLEQHGITALPILADALPVLLNNLRLTEDNAIDVLRNPETLSAFKDTYF